MNKLALMQKALVKRAIVSLALVAGAGAVLFATDTMTANEIQSKATTEDALNKAREQLATLHKRLEQASVAEKRLVEILNSRTNPELAVKNDTLIQELRDSKAHFRLTNMKLNLVPESLATQPELANPNFDVSVRDGLSIECDAISDVHVYSFINDTMRRSSGFVRLKSMDIERKSDLTPSAITQLISGQNVASVSAKLQFTVVAIQPKEVAATPASTPPATGGTP